MSSSTPSYMDSANLFLAGLAMAGTTEKAQKALDVLLYSKKRIANEVRKTLNDDKGA